MQKKQAQKILFFFLKTGIAVISLFYIWYKLKQFNYLEFNFPEFDTFHIAILVFVIFLMPLNWFIESYKWKYLVRKLEHISFGKSVKAVFTGITFAIFTPNRIGELAGRIFVLKKEHRAKAVFATATGSLSQMMITVILGIISGIVFLFFYGFKSEGIDLNILLFLKIISVFFLLFGLYLFFNLRIVADFLNKFNLSEKLKSAVYILASYKKAELMKVLLFSFLRYLVFLLQFYLLLKLFAVEISFSIAVMTITLTYLISSVIPSFTLTEIGIRGSAAIFFMGMFSSNISGIVAATALLWIINLAVPAIIGAGLFYLTRL